MSNYCFEHIPTVAERFWRKLGYRGAMVELPEGAGKGKQGWIKNNTNIHLSFWDRLLVLISGKIRVETEIFTDSSVVDTESYSCVMFPRPGRKYEAD